MSSHMQAAEAKKQKEAAREVVKRAPAKKLAGALLKKGYQVGRPQLSVGGLLPLHLHDSQLQLECIVPGCSFFALLKRRG